VNAAQAQAEAAFWLLPERFVTKVTPVPMGCWLWGGCKNHKGYGSFRLGRTTTLAHRYVFARICGPIPEGMTVDHICEVRDCVRPSHLRLLSRPDNSLRRNGIEGGIRPCGHPYSKGRCRPCNNAYYRRKYAEDPHDREVRKLRARTLYAQMRLTSGSGKWPL